MGAFAPSRCGWLGLACAALLLGGCPSLSGFTGGGDGGQAMDGSADALNDVRGDSTVPTEAGRDEGPETGDAGTGVDASPCDEDAAGYTRCGASCVDLTSSRDHCGSCAHSCLGGGCGNGQCQPFLLAQTQWDVNGLAVDAVNVYWTEGNLVAACPSDGGCGDGGTVLYTGAATADLEGIALGSATVYFTDTQGGTLDDVLKNGTNSGTLVSGLSGPSGLALDSADNELFFGSGGPDAGAGALQSYSLASTATTTVISGLAGAYKAVAVDRTNVYVLTYYGSAIVSCGLGSTCGASPNVVVSSLMDPQGVFSDGTNVWISDYDPSGSSSVVYKCPVGSNCGNPPIPFASGLESAVGIVADAAYVYWAAGFSILRCPVAGCPASPNVMADLSTWSSGPALVAQDANAVYFTTAFEVGKVAK